MADSVAGSSGVTLEQLVADLEADGILLRASGDLLHYKAVPGALTPDREALLRTRKAELLQLLRRRSRDGVDPPRIDGAEAVWVPAVAQTSLFDLPAPPFLMSVERRWRTPDPAAFQLALDQLVMRHDSLRTRFIRDRAGRLWGITERSRSVPVQHVDLSDLEERARSERARAITQQMEKAPVDHERGPLLRVALLKLTEEETACILIACHTIFDGASAEIFFRDLLVLYRGCLHGTPVDLPPLHYPFRVHAQRQHAWLNSAAGHEHLLHIRQRMLGDGKRFWPQPDSSITVRPDIPPAMGQIDGPQLEALRQTVRRAGTTVFVAALAATGIALSRWAKSTDAFLWIADSGRHLPEVTDMVGCLAIHTPFAMRVPDTQTFAEALQSIWNCYREDIRHPFPGQRIKPIAARARETGLFTHIELNFMAANTADHELMGADTRQRCATGSPLVESISRYDDVTIFAVRPCFYEGDNGLAWSIRHKSRMFAHTNIDHLSSLIGAALSMLAFAPDALLSELQKGRSIHAEGRAT